MDSALAGSDEEEEANEVVDAVFEELNIDLFAGMKNAPSGVRAQPDAAEEVGGYDRIAGLAYTMSGAQTCVGCC